MGALAAGAREAAPKRWENAWLKSTMARENHQLRSRRCADFSFGYDLYQLHPNGFSGAYVAGRLWHALCVSLRGARMPGMVGAGGKGDAHT